MPIIYSNFEWMFYNIFLSLLGVIFAFLLFRSKKLLLKIIFFVLWLLSVPNTIYLITDLVHLPEQFVKVGLLLQAVLVFQYLSVIILGITTFFLSFYMFEKALTKFKPKDQISNVIILVIINYLIAFGVALGRFERVSSWFVLTDPIGVLDSSLDLLQSSKMITLILLFGSTSTLLYFTLKKFIKINHFLKL